MRPTSKDLIQRAQRGDDNALAAALGILPQGGPGGTYGADFGGYGPYGFGFGFGADPTTATPTAAPLAAVASPVPALAANPHHPAHMAQAHAHMQHAAARNYDPHTQGILANHYHQQAKTQERLSLITPNSGSGVDIQRYDFSINATPGITIAPAAATVQGMSLQPSTTIRPQRCTFNAPTFAFVMVSNILVGNVNGMVGGATDAFNYGPASMGIHLDLPSINPSNRIQVQCTYTGLVPPVYGLGFVYPFTASFQCPATTVPNPSLQV
jgi:hypothetical protein